MQNNPVLLEGKEVYENTVVENTTIKLTSVIQKEHYQDPLEESVFNAGFAYSPRTPLHLMMGVKVIVKDEITQDFIWLCEKNITVLVDDGSVIAGTVYVVHTSSVPAGKGVIFKTLTLGERHLLNILEGIETQDIETGGYTLCEFVKHFSY